jgi:hypothetical protein
MEKPKRKEITGPPLQVVVCRIRPYKGLKTSNHQGQTGSDTVIADYRNA